MPARKPHNTFLTHYSNARNYRNAMNLGDFDQL